MGYRLNIDVSGRALQEFQSELALSQDYLDFTFSRSFLNLESSLTYRVFNLVTRFPVARDFRDSQTGESWSRSVAPDNLDHHRTAQMSHFLSHPKNDINIINTRHDNIRILDLN